METSRRYFAAVEVVRRTGVGDEQVDRFQAQGVKAGIDKLLAGTLWPLTREQLTGGPVRWPCGTNGSVVTGTKTLQSRWARQARLS